MIALQVEDTVGSLFSFLCIHDDYLDRILEKHVALHESVRHG